jgi:hypothetical protein
VKDCEWKAAGKHMCEHVQETEMLSEEDKQHSNRNLVERAACNSKRLMDE